MSGLQPDDEADEFDESEHPDECDVDDLDEPELVPCPNCGQSISEEAARCHHCGNYVSRELATRRIPPWVIIAAGLALVAIWLMVSN